MVVASRDPNEALKVFDDFTDRESLEAFGQILMPILEQVGVDVGQPEVQPVHNHFALELAPAHA